MKLRAVLLDAAGTLIHPHEAIGASYARIASEHGVDVPAWRLDDAFRRVLRSAPPMPATDDASERAWWREIVRATFRAADQMQRFRDFDGCFDALFAHFARPEAWRAAPDAHAALAALQHQGRRVAVASNFDQRLHAVLAGLGLASHLDLIWLPRDAGVPKPDPRFFTAACTRLGVAPAETVAVGDDPELDLAPAHSAGLRAIDVASLASLGALPERIDALEREETPAR